MESNSPSAGVFDVRSILANTPMTSPALRSTGSFKAGTHCAQADCGMFHTNDGLTGATADRQFSGMPIAFDSTWL